MSRRDKTVEEAKEYINSPVEKIEELIPSVPTGSTLFNLALSDNPNKGWALGTMVNLIGDSSSGKTFLALTCLAEMACDPAWDNYRLIYDDAEHACNFDMRLFGPLADRLEAPNYDDDGLPIFSELIEDFDIHIDMAFEDDDERPFVYILDSFDSLSSKDEEAFLKKRRKAIKEGTKFTGTYGTEKAKFGSQFLRSVCGRIENTQSIVIVISQTRDDINPMTFSKKTRSGGKALKFYSSHEHWMAIIQRLKSHNRICGVVSKIKTSKNKITGKEREVQIPIYYDYGVDDILSCIDFLVDEKYWKKKKQTIIAHDFDIEASRMKLMEEIEENDLEDDLKEIVGEVWNDIEEKVSMGKN